MAEDDGNKTEQPTAKRLSEAKERGQFARAPDLQLVSVLAASTLGISVLGPEITDRVASVAVGIFANIGRNEIRPEAVYDWSYDAVRFLFAVAMPLLGFCALAGVLVGGVQSGFSLAWKNFGFNPDRLDVAKGFQRIFSTDSLVKVSTELLKMMVVAWIVVSGLKSVMADPVFFTPVPVHRIGEFIRDSSTALMWRSILALGGIGGLYYVYQLIRTKRGLLMSKQEVKDEAKQSEGDPKVKAALRAMARRILQRQMLHSVKTADVVITNPTHFAVALRYEQGQDSAPVVVAKGERAFARRIKAVAMENGVPMVENPPVARMLYKFAKIGKTIPSNLYNAVAEILSFVYRVHRGYFMQLGSRRREDREAQESVRGYGAER
jgi:flagellar biosynthetic protein FlhB